MGVKGAGVGDILASQAKRPPAAGLVLDGTRRAHHEHHARSLAPFVMALSCCYLTPMLCLLAALALRCPCRFSFFLSSVLLALSPLGVLRVLAFAKLAACFFNGVFIEYGWRCSVSFGGNCNPGKGVPDG